MLFATENILKGFLINLSSCDRVRSSSISRKFMVSAVLLSTDMRTNINLVYVYKVLQNCWYKLCLQIENISFTNGKGRRNASFFRYNA